MRRSPLDPLERFAVQVSGHLPDLERLARQLGARGADADDFVQETCRRSLEASARFVEGTDLRAWLFRILRNIHFDHRRKSWREVPIAARDEELPSLEPVEPPVWRTISDGDLALALASLSPHYRYALLLHCIDGMTYAEVAKKLQIALSTVGTRLLRGRARLRALLESAAATPGRAMIRAGTMTATD